MSTRRKYGKILTALLIVTAGIVHAEVIDSSTVGFTVKNSVNVTADTSEVYYTLVDEIGNWWDSAHTYSGDAGNLSLDDKAGGCFCEQLQNGGSVQHLQVVYAAPGKLLRMRGALGPLQSLAVTGSMTWSLRKTNSGTNIEFIYTVGGYRSGGLQSLASIVDKVLSEQLTRLKDYIGNKHQKK